MGVGKFWRVGGVGAGAEEGRLVVAPSASVRAFGRVEPTHADLAAYERVSGSSLFRRMSNYDDVQVIRIRRRIG